MEDPELSSLSLSPSFPLSLTGEKLDSISVSHTHQAGSVHRHIPHWRGHLQDGALARVSVEKLGYVLSIHRIAKPGRKGKYLD